MDKESKLESNRFGTENIVGMILRQYKLKKH